MLGANILYDVITKEWNAFWVFPAALLIVFGVGLFISAIRDNGRTE